jgi:flagellar assembly protein FliH
LQLERFIPPSFDTVQTGAKAKPFTPKSFGKEKKEEPPPPPPPPTFSEAELKAAEADGYRKGFVEGELEGKKIAESELARLDHTIEAALGPLAEQLLSLFKAYNQFAREQTMATTQLAMALAQKIAGDALAKDSLPLIEPLARDCIARILGEASIVVTVQEPIAARLEEKLGRYFEHSKEPGNIVIHGDASMHPADCTIAWPQGQARITHSERLKDLQRMVDEIAAGNMHQYTDITPTNQGDAP